MQMETNNSNQFIWSSSRHDHWCIYILYTSRLQNSEINGGTPILYVLYKVSRYLFIGKFSTGPTDHSWVNEINDCISFSCKPSRIHSGLCPTTWISFRHSTMSSWRDHWCPCRTHDHLGKAGMKERKENQQQRPPPPLTSLIITHKQRERDIPHKDTVGQYCLQTAAPSSSLKGQKSACINPSIWDTFTWKQVLSFWSVSFFFGKRAEDNQLLSMGFRILLETMGISKSLSLFPGLPLLFAHMGSIHNLVQVFKPLETHRFCNPSLCQVRLTPTPPSMHWLLTEKGKPMHVYSEVITTDL